MGNQIPDLTYAVTKAYALKGHLLEPAILEGLAESKGLEDLIVRMRATVYGDTVTKVEKPYSAHKLELAFRGHLASIHRSLLRVAPTWEFLNAYYLHYIATNLKAVLKGKALGKSFESISSYVDLQAEELIGRRDVVVRALSAGSLEESVNLLSTTEFGDEVTGAAKAYRETGDARVFDIYLDGAFYKNLVGAFLRLQGRLGTSTEAEGMWQILSAEIDSYNVIATLRAKLWDLAPSAAKSLLVRPFFAVSQRHLLRMLESDSIGDALRILEVTGYRRLLPETTGDSDSIAHLEDSFGFLVYSRAQKAFTWNAYGVGTTLALIKLKELEVKNLSTIAFGVEQNLGSTRILPKLVLLKR